MKLHLPHSLRKALLCAFALAATLGTFNTYAGVLHSQVSLTTYTDFGQNMGRYVTGSRVNALLSAIREQEGGVVITYLEGHDDYTLKHCMPSFESTGDNGAYAAIGYNYIATVQHNGVQNPTFTGRYIGGGNSLHYIGIEYRYSNMFLSTPDTDYKITRLSKVITDVQTSAVYTGTVPSDTLIYRAGAGTMSVRNTDGSSHDIYGAYQYITGAIARTGGMNVVGASGVGRGLTTNFNYREAGISDLNPIPFNGDGGDSGSPLWVWNEETGAYEYLMAAQAVNGPLTDTYSKGAPEWSVEVMDSYSRNVTVGEGTGTVRIGAVTTQGETLMDSYGVAEQWSGVVTNASGEAITTFQGVRSGINTWMSLTPEVDKDNWYAYGEAYLNAADAVSETKALSKATLFCTQNLVFNSSQAQNSIEIADAGVDLGVGYARFSRAEGAGGTVHYSISGGMFNHAGYVVDEGVAVHLTEANTDAAYVREWRKVGEGDLYIEGAGDNHVVLNVGGAGSVFLNESGANAYAAYNVLANTGATVVLQGGVNQIARDFTFGNGGGRLDFCGHSMTWDNSAANVSADGFTIHALTEEAVITNSSAKDVTLTVVNPENVYLGSFQDQKDAGALNVVYTGTGKWTLNTIATNLSNSGKSSFTVQQGSVELAGSNTMHAMGSIDGRSTQRLVNAEDWHYADMAADVLVEGGTFILGSHARLTGDVTLGQNASLIIHEGVLHEYEYIEGGQRLEDTTSDFYRQFYGLKGDINTAEGSMVLISFDNATTAEQVYGGSITGGGDLLVSLGESGATLHLTGESSIGGYKELLGGGLISDNGVAALGSAADNDYAWRLNNNAYIAAKGSTGDELLELVRRDSLGTLALTQAQETDLKLGEKGYNGLIVGALEGLDVHYGTENAELTTVQNEGKAQWLLGGGGGNLIVDFALQDGTAELVLGNEYTTGNVTLTNSSNEIGTISFMGQVTLSYTDEAALGGATVDLNYTNRMQLLSSSGMGGISTASAGVVLVDKLGGAALDMTGHPELYIGAGTAKQLDAAPVIAAGTAYRFGGIDGTLTVNAVLANAGSQPTGLFVDGQTFSGGVLELAQAATITGAVDVRGYDPARMLPTMVQKGDITLRLTAENAIASASSVTMEDGGIIDINGTAQTFHNMDMAQGSLLTDGSAARGGSVVVDVDSGRTYLLAGTLDVAALTKVGQGNLELSDINYCGTFTIDSGSVTLNSSNSFGATGILAVSAGGSGIVTQQGNATTISSFMEVGQGGMLELRGNEYTLTNEAVNTAVDAGTISVQAKKLNINNSEVADIGGTLSFDSASNQTLFSDRSANNTTRNIAHLHVAGGSNKELHLDERTWNTIWNIAKLTGEGKVMWDSDTQHWFSSRVILSGENTFAGQFTAARTGAGTAARRYQSYVEAGHDRAMQAMDVTINGYGPNSRMSLAVNTDNLEMKSLSGNGYAVVYAGAAREGTANDTGETLAPDPVSTRKATLTITGNSSATFSGDVQGGDNGMGLSLVKTGSGTQTFNGGTVVFNDVSALGGTLNLNSGGLTVNGDISLARGAALSMSKAYNLGSGKLLTVGGLATDASAQLSTTLTLGGGTISFSGQALNNSNAALLLNSLSGNSVTIDFSETSALEAGTYYLANGNWTGVSVTGVALPYMDVTFQKGSSSLMAVFSLKGGSHVWAGTPSSHTWSGDNFGPQGVSFGTTDTAVFTDAASGKDVLIGSSRTIGSLIFDSSGQYTVGSTGGSTVTASTLQQLGRGTTVVNGGISATDIQVQAGGLLVRDAALLEGAASISGGGTLGIDVAGTVSLNGKLSAGNPLGTLHILSGSTYASNSQLNAGRVLVDGGAAFQLQANQSANVETGNGATVALGGSTLSGSLTLAGDTLVTSSGGTLAAKVYTGGHLLVTSGDMYLKDTGISGSLRVESGTLNLNGGGLYDNLTDITIGSSGTLQMSNGNSITSGITVNMEDGAILASQAGGSNTNLTIDVNMLGGTAEIRGAYCGNSLTMDGNVSGDGILKIGHNEGEVNTWTLASHISDSAVPGASLAVEVDSNVTLTGSNTYSGGTTVNGCTLRTSGATALGTGGVTMNGGTLQVTQSLRIASIGGSGGSINFNGMTLTLTGDADAVYGGAVQGTPGIVKLGTGRQEFSQAAAYGNVSVQAGTLALNATDLRGQVSVASGATLQLDGERTILHAPIYNGGALTLTGGAPVLELANDGAFAFKDATYRDIDGAESPDGNGFALNAHIQVVYMGEGASITAPAATSVTYLGDTLQLDSNGAVWLGEKSSHSYYVRQGIVTYDEAFAQKAATAGLESFLLATAPDEAPAELEITEDLPQDIVIRTSGSGGILNIGTGVNLDAASLDAAASTVLKGGGSLVLASGVVSLPQSVQLGSDWAGSVVLSGSVGGPFGFAGLSNARSHVKLAGVSTWIAANSTIGANLLLEGTDRGDRTGGALIITGADNGRTYTFTGIIGGSGDFVYRQDDRGARSPRFYLRGDLSGWTGNFVNYNGDSGTHPSLYLDGGGDVVMGGGIIQKRESGQSNGVLDVYLGGASTTSVTIGGDVLCQGGTLNFTVNADTTFNGAVTAVNSMAVGSGKSVTFKDQASIAALSGAGSVDIDSAGATVALAGMGSYTGAITVSSGTLELGSGISSLSGQILNSELGNVVIGATLTAGTIVNRGTITVSDLMVASGATYTDVHGSSSTGNGFVSSLEVCSVGVIQDQGGTILYGGRDVTQQVLDTGRIQNVTNNATYYINSTDAGVSFSDICSASQGALEHIVFASGTSLKVDNAAGGVHLHSSQLAGSGTPTLQLQADAVMVLDSSLSATMEVGNGSTADVRAADAAKGSAFSITKTGAGKLRFSGEAGASAAAGSLNLSAGSVEVADGGAPFTTITLANNTSLSFVAEGASAEFAVERIQDSSSDNYGRNITVGEGAELNLGCLNNGWGLGTLRVDGVLNVADSLDFATGNNNSKDNNIITGSGVINAQTLNFRNVGTYNITNMAELNVLESMSHSSNTKINVSGSTINFYGLVNETNGSLIFGPDKSSVNVCSRAGVNHFATLDMGNGKQSLAELRLGAQTESTVGALWMNSKQGNRILLEELASITVGNTVTIKGASPQEEGELRLAQSGASVEGGQYSIGSTSYRISRAEVSVGTSSGAKTISNQMSDVRLVNGGGNTLTENNSSNTSFAGVDASSGDINFLNKASGLEVQDIVLGEGRAVGVYKAGNAVEAGEASLTISGKLVAGGADSRLNANVVMEAGSTLDASATEGQGIALGSSLTIKENIHLSDADFEAVAGLGYGDSYILFNGVDSLTLGQTTYAGDITPEMKVDAAGWFRGVEPEHIYMVYDGTNVGLYCMVAMPEPTTSTLSLLALATLAVRRRKTA